MAFRERFITSYLDPLQAEAQVGEIVARFPHLCRAEELPHLTHGYFGQKAEAHGQSRMKVLRITAPGGVGVKPAVLLMRSHHAREWINPMAVLETARQLLENYRPEDPDPRVQAVVRTLERVEYLIVPESNPDGARLSFFDTGRRMWRKNLRPPDGSGCAGVDCNRNFPTFWGEEGSSPAPCSEVYRGPDPLSEPEAANVAELVERSRNIIFAVDSHSHGEAIFRPSPGGGTFVGHQPVSAEDDAVYRHLEERMNERIQTVAGTRYETGTTSNHAGTTDEFFFFAHHVYGFDLECGNDFQPPVSEAVTASLEVAAAIHALGACAAGETGLDVDGLLAQRQAMPTDSMAAGRAPHVATEPWEVPDLSPDLWRRFRLRCEPLQSDTPQRQYEYLVSRGLDVQLRTAGGDFEIIASAADLTTLVGMGYRPVVTDDLLS